MRSPLGARSARSAVLAGVAVLALATGGVAYGSIDHGVSTKGVKTGTPATAKTVKGGTASVRPAQGVAPAKAAPAGSTAGMAP